MEITINKLTITLAIIILLFACKQHNNFDTVELEPTLNKNLTLGKINDIIQLETTEESLIGYVTKVNVDLPNNRIFVQSDFNVYLFNAEGKFITKLIKGRGPGEISMILSISPDSKNKKFYAIDSGNFICVFDYNGKLLSKYKLESFYSSDIYLLDEENVILHCYNVGTSEKNFVGIFNFSENKVVRKFIPAEESPYPPLIYMVGNNFTTNGNKLFFARTNIFGLFEFKADTFQRILTYDIGNRAVPESFYNKYVEQRKISSFGEDAREKNYVPYIMNSFYFSNHYLVTLYDEKYSCYAIDEKNKNKIYMNGPLPVYFNLPDVKSLRLPRGMQDNFLVFSCTPLDFFELNPVEETKEIEIDGRKINVKYDANPFLIIVK